MTGMRTVEEHARVIAELLQPTPSEPTPLSRSDGLVLAQDLVATIDLPPSISVADHVDVVHGQLLRDAARLMCSPLRTR